MLSRVRRVYFCKEESYKRIFVKEEKRKIVEKLRSCKIRQDDLASLNLPVIGCRMRGISM